MKGDTLCWATDCRARRSLKSIFSEDAPRRVALVPLVARERTRKCILHSRDRSSPASERERLVFLIFTEDSAVFCGKCAVSILAVSMDPKREAENIYRLRERYEIE